MTVEPLPRSALYKATDPSALGFATTDELADATTIIGQGRAAAAIEFGVGMPHQGYNLFVHGPSGSGRHTAIEQALSACAATQPPPPDWCYVNNFAAPHRPIAMQLPPGMAATLRSDMERLLDDLLNTIPAMFESEDHRNRVQAVDAEFKHKNETEFEALAEKAHQRNVALIRSPMGFAMAPLRNGAVLKPDEFNALSEETRRKIQEDIEALQQELQEIMQRVPEWDKQRRDRIREINQEMTRFAVKHLIDALREKYAVQAAVLTYMDLVETDIVDSVEAFLPTGETPQGATLPFGGAQASPRGRAGLFRKYLVNVVVQNSSAKGAPVVYEASPTHDSLVGRVEYLSEMGALVTDFGLIKGGALHRANGGYLILDALRLLQMPYAWDVLKRALRAREIVIESIGQMLNLINTVSLEPQAIPLNVKVVLVGGRMLYYLLSQADPEFEDLFKVTVDFDDDMTRDEENQRLYARVIASFTRKESLKPLSAAAVARIIEHGARLAGDSEKLTARLGAIADLARESDYCAKQSASATVDATHVEQAIAAQVHRLDRLRERGQEAILQGTLLIDTTGLRVGQINGLAVVTLGGFSFGRPNRITARVRPGRGEIVDIEREVELGGPLHSKGVLILAGFLGGHYAGERPLSLQASLVFEQSYGGVEGDSASSAELYALLSALAEIPIRQSLAVTGSVNQHGMVQAIGGANEKIEAFFDVCAAGGLTGEQGVLIPKPNVRHLMLRKDVVEAASAGKFHIWPVTTIEEGIELLTGVPAGRRDASGNYPDGSVSARIVKRLTDFANVHRAFATDRGGEDRK